MVPGWKLNGLAYLVLLMLAGISAGLRLYQLPD